MTRLSVNINKVATLRNARGGNVPNVVKVVHCEALARILMILMDNGTPAPRRKAYP